MPRSYRRDAKSRISGVQQQVKRENEGDRWGRELTPKEKSDYAVAMKQMRASYGLTDGLRTTPEGMNDYLARRRQEDQRRRGW